MESDVFRFPRSAADSPRSSPPKESTRSMSEKRKKQEVISNIELQDAIVLAHKKRKCKRMKQRETILEVLKANPGRWFLPQYFMQNPDHFVGYEASARLSEIAKEFPKNIETKREGRQMARRWVN